MKIENLELHSPYLEHEPIFYDEVEPTPLQNAYLIDFNSVLAKEMGLSCVQDESVVTQWLNGQYLVKNSKPFAMCYAGHQFGFFVPRLGDGRAINLGKLGSYNLQLKGAGQTLYSRLGDGRAVLRSSIREYLMSEAMHGLGIATTRALGIVGSSHKVAREKIETAAMVMRASESWIRFGSFEFFAHHKMPEQLEALAKYVINESYPHLKGEEDAYFLMYEAVVDKTALMIAQWQSVGFNHGVMNTDNMSIAGLSIDYGPFAFLDAYNPDYVCNHTDHEGRYSFSNQPKIAHWNLHSLAKALSYLVDLDRLEAALEKFGPNYGTYYLQFMGKKLGLEIQSEEDTSLLEDLLDILDFQCVDYTLFFRTLSYFKGNRAPLLALCLDDKDMNMWLERYEVRLGEGFASDVRLEKMQSVNPKYVLKNYILQEAIEKAQEGDISLVKDLLSLAKAPFDEHKELERYAQATPTKERGLRLSCSS